MGVEPATHDGSQTKIEIGTKKRGSTVTNT